MVLAFYTVPNEFGLDRWLIDYQESGRSAGLRPLPDATRAMAMLSFTAADFDVDHRDVEAQKRLLRERIAGTPLAKRVVAAYVVGWPISRTADLPALGLPACSSAGQTGCILSWLTFGEPANPDLVLNSYQGSAGLNGAKRRREDLLCVNPLTGSANSAAPPQANPGTLVPTQDLKSAILEPGLVGARCDDGLLIVSGDIPPLGPFVLPGNNYHVYDYALFWGAIRRDAERRLQAWPR